MVISSKFLDLDLPDWQSDSWSSCRMGGGKNKVRELEQPCIAPPTYATGPMFFLAKISDKEFKSSVAALQQTVNLTAGIEQPTVSGCSAQTTSVAPWAGIVESEIPLLHLYGGVLCW